MKTIYSVFTVSALLLFCSCIRTLNPLFEDNQLVLELQLFGKWANVDSSSMMEFNLCSSNDSSRTCNKYKVEIIEKSNNGLSDTNKFIAMTGKLDKFLFLDLFPDLSNNTNECYNKLLNYGNFVPAHTFYKVFLSKDSLGLAEMDYKWFQTHAKKLHVSYFMHGKDDLITLTCSTAELQKLCKKYANNDEVFQPDKSMHRIK
jgi:hypothetical protein